MKKDTGSKKILARGKTVSVGIDMHKRSWHLTAVSDGVVLFKGTIPPSYEALNSIFDRFVNCKIKIAYETGPSGFGLYDHLEDADIRCIVVTPNLIPYEHPTVRRFTEWLSRRAGLSHVPTIHLLPGPVQDALTTGTESSAVIGVTASP